MNKNLEKQIRADLQDYNKEQIIDLYLQVKFDQEIQKQQIADLKAELEEVQGQYAYECECNKQFVECQKENEKLKQQLKEKDEKSDDFVEYLNGLIDNREKTIKNYQQQLKEKDEEIADLNKMNDEYKKNAKTCIKHWRKDYSELKQQLKINTHEVCEKIRNKFPKDDIPDETTYYLHEFLDQLDGGVK